MYGLKHVPKQLEGQNTYHFFGKDILIKGYTVCSLFQTQDGKSFFLFFLQVNLYAIYWDFYYRNPLFGCYTANNRQFPARLTTLECNELKHFLYHETCLNIHVFVCVHFLFESLSI